MKVYVITRHSHRDGDYHYAMVVQRRAYYDMVVLRDIVVMRYRSIVTDNRHGLMLVTRR